LHAKIKKKALEGILKTLVDKEELKCKEYGKALIYL
jgi:hypothetical protein